MCCMIGLGGSTNWISSSQCSYNVAQVIASSIGASVTSDVVLGPLVVASSFDPRGPPAFDSGN